MTKYKVIFLGNVDVGKTSTIVRFSEDKFLESGKGEEIDQITKDVQIDDQTVTISVMDTAGQERFQTLTSNYYWNADVILVVYDMTNQDSYKDVEGFYVEGNRYSPRSLKYLVANKNDLVDQRVVTTEQGERVAEKLGIKYFETSAKTGYNVKELFQTIAKDLLSWGDSNTSETRNGVVFISGEPPKRQNSRLKCEI